MLASGRGTVWLKLLTLACGGEEYSVYIPENTARTSKFKSLRPTEFLSPLVRSGWCCVRLPRKKGVILIVLGMLRPTPTVRDLAQNHGQQRVCQVLFAHAPNQSRT
ncbi:hypothetical protein C2E23DRAFT_444093 [Lenzites betulinus]|nr:hypothetical protein C2E23DRAFT_444093 [Lenzites betulinus]